MRLYLASPKEFPFQEGQTGVHGCIRQPPGTYVKATAKESMPDSCSTTVGNVISWQKNCIPLMFTIYLFCHAMQHAGS